MIRVRRRGTTRSTPLLAITALVLSGLMMPATANAATIEQTKAEIARLSVTLSQEEQTSERTANEYDAAKVQLADIKSHITGLQGKEAKKRAAIAVTGKALVKAVVAAYVLGASEAQIIALFNQDVTSSDARMVYEDQVIGNLTKLKDAYVAAKESLATTLSDVIVQRNKSQQQTQHIQALLQENVANENATQATLTKVTRDLKAKIIAYEIKAGATAARDRNIAGEEEAVAAASAVGGTPAANDVLAAIAAAAPPSITETEYPAMKRVLLSQLQSGDLLFYYNLDGDHEVDHVVMYAGSDPYGASTVIAAAHTGTNVSYEPLFTFGLVGAT